MNTDPYRYFRVEARELLDGLSQGALELEKGTAGRSTVQSLLRLAHTLKGASRVVRQPSIADLAHGVEDILSPYREAEAPVPKSQTQEMLRLLDQIGAGLSTLDRSPDAPPAPGGSTPPQPHSQEEPLDTVRVDVEEVGQVLNGLSEAAVVLRKLQGEAETARQMRRIASQLLHQLEFAASGPDPGLARKIRPLAEELCRSIEQLGRRISSDTGEMQREIAVARENASQLLLLPGRFIVPSLKRAVHDACEALGKEADFSATGGEIRLDAHVLLAMRDAVLHLVRNAVAHGLETGAVRLASGKPRIGRIELRIERRGDRVAFVCNDDGAGMNLAAIRQAAVKKGIVPPEAGRVLTSRQAIDLVLAGGLSTAPATTAISGRGIGLDVVRQTVARLKGEVSVETAEGRGTTVEIQVPASLTAIIALQVEAGGTPVSIPMESVRETISLRASDLAQSGNGEVLAYGEDAVPFVFLSRVLTGGSGPSRDHWPVVVVESSGRLLAVGVDRLLGTGTIIVRAIPAVAGAAAIVAGAALDGEGNPQLVLDPAALVSGTTRVETGEARAVPPRPVVLVVDDSLTTRMVEQSILESAGHEVDLARSAEEGLEMARSKRYNLFLVDVEMPGMDGFDFLQQTRADPVLRDIPAVLVTSRNAPEDRRRGQEAGANAYIVKSEFEQTRFLETIGKLVRC